MNTREQMPQPDNEEKSFEQNQEDKEQLEISDTKTFQEAIAAGNILEAAAWFEKARNEEKYDARWIDHRSRELMKYFCETGNLDEAKKYVDDAQSEEGRSGRREKIEKLRKEAESKGE